MKNTSGRSEICGTSVYQTCTKNSHVYPSLQSVFVGENSLREGTDIYFVVNSPTLPLYSQTKIR